MRSTLILAAIGAVMQCLPAHAQQAVQLEFEHHDWELVCDNTRTCRAAGYHAQEFDKLPMSVILERAAGPDTPVTARLRLGDIDAPAPAPASLVMLVEGREYGEVKLDDSEGTLSPRQITPLLRAIAGTGKVAWRAQGRIWILSGKGASAVLLKMDEFQGRLDTPGALLRKGSKPESAVLPALPKPIVNVPTDAADEMAPLTGEARRVMLDALRKTGGSANCDIEAVAESEQERVSYARLDRDRMLVSARCWRTVHTEGYGYWVVNRQPPFAPTLVTDSGTDYREGVIYAGHEERGFGDCWSFSSWFWDGRRFVLTEKARSGMCRGVTQGGAWFLPSVVSEVRRKGD